MYEDQAIEKGKSHNIFKDDIDDSAMVKQYKLDPALAYTPKINGAIINAQHRDTYNNYRKQGMSEAKAMKAANSARSDANQRLSRDLKLRKSRGE